MKGVGAQIFKRGTARLFQATALQHSLGGIYVFSPGDEIGHVSENFTELVHHDTQRRRAAPKCGTRKSSPAGEGGG